MQLAVVRGVVRRGPRGGRGPSLPEGPAGAAGAGGGVCQQSARIQRKILEIISESCPRAAAPAREHEAEGTQPCSADPVTTHACAVAMATPRHGVHLLAAQAGLSPLTVTSRGGRWGARGPPPRRPGHSAPRTAAVSRRPQGLGPRPRPAPPVPPSVRPSVRPRSAGPGCRGLAVIGPERTSPINIHRDVPGALAPADESLTSFLLGSFRRAKPGPSAAPGRGDPRGEGAPRAGTRSWAGTGPGFPGP